MNGNDIHTNYFEVQRGHFTKKDNDKRRFHDFISWDYMGSTEFELGTQRKSLNIIFKKDNMVDKFVHSIKGKSIISYSRNISKDNVARVLNIIGRTVDTRGIYFKEWTAFDNFLNDDECNVDWWLDQKNNIVFFENNEDKIQNFLYAIDTLMGKFNLFKKFDILRRRNEINGKNYYFVKETNKTILTLVPFSYDFEKFEEIKEFYNSFDLYRSFKDEELFDHYFNIGFVNNILEEVLKENSFLPSPKNHIHNIDVFCLKYETEEAHLKDIKCLIVYNKKDERNKSELPYIKVSNIKNNKTFYVNFNKKFLEFTERTRNHSIERLVGFLGKTIGRIIDFK